MHIFKFQIKISQISRHSTGMLQSKLPGDGTKTDIFQWDTVEPQKLIHTAVNN